MNAPVQQAQVDILNRLYSMKLEQIEQANREGNSLRYQVLLAEAEAILSALNSTK
ncbi:hypothetical protein FE848_09895 [Marinobacter sp. 1-3A]|uniref:hypothetical protein n=1 Tax=Marinobacter sp. 1-3A TaxID=2582920 RepID=UPI00190607D3|nr:hypothetical protein [Marinobacter sp. 1-3A]MBK1873534.1 hypothetical protein [Marinobacter sp. 1-3A]